MTNKKRQTPPLFSLEAGRRGKGISVTICGIICIGDYSEEQIVLKSHGGKISLRGRKLSLNIYENNTAEIVGRLEEIGFDYGKG